jgi:hypothetical protein
MDSNSKACSDEIDLSTSYTKWRECTCTCMYTLGGRDADGMEDAALNE